MRIINVVRYFFLLVIVCALATLSVILFPLFVINQIIESFLEISLVRLLGQTRMTIASRKR